MGSSPTKSTQHQRKNRKVMKNKKSQTLLQRTFIYRGNYSENWIMKHNIQHGHENQQHVTETTIKIANKNRLFVISPAPTVI